MAIKFLPPNTDNEKYSPIGALKKFRDAVRKENGSIDSVFRKIRYRQVVEMWYASPLAVLIYRSTGNKFYLYPSDNPDIHFIREIDENHNQEGFSVEVMTIYDHDKIKFDGNYLGLVKKIWDKKGGVDYDRAELLLVSRLVGQIDVDRLKEEIGKYKWKFLRIWFSIYSEKDSNWTLFDIKPYEGYTSSGIFRVGLTELPY